MKCFHQGLTVNALNTSGSDDTEEIFFLLTSKITGAESEEEEMILNVSLLLKGRRVVLAFHYQTKSDILH